MLVDYLPRKFRLEKRTGTSHGCRPARVRRCNEWGLLQGSPVGEIRSSGLAVYGEDGAGNAAVSSLKASGYGMKEE
jgi:hypothetical protein